jgi:shikimate kinase
MPAMNIILIGYRGSGKTVIGRLLAERLGLDFVDSDAAVCGRFGIDSITDIWQQHGEPAWREMEVEVTRQCCAMDNQVISLGGGTVMQSGARQAIADSAQTTCVYLYAPVEVLHQRIEADANTAAARPSLTGKGGGIEEVQQVLAQRDPVYRQAADLVLDVTNLSIDATVAELADRLAD